MKKKIMIMITALLLLFSFTACGGEEIVEDTVVETKEIGSVYSTDAAYVESPEYKEILDIMEGSTAQFFYVDYDSDTAKHTVYETNMEKYNEIAQGIPNATETSKAFSKGLLHFANLTDKNIQVDCNTWFKGLVSNSAGISMICGGGEGKEESLYTYFKENGIKLSSEEMGIKKLGIMSLGVWDEETNAEGYILFFIAEGNITVDAKTSDPCNTFHEAGETKAYTIKGWGEFDTYFKDLTLNRIYLEPEKK